MFMNSNIFYAAYCINTITVDHLLIHFNPAYIHFIMKIKIIVIFLDLDDWA